MNVRFARCPEVIGTVRQITEDGDDTQLGDRVVGIQIINGDAGGLVQLDIRDFHRRTNLTVEIELPELVSAISVATLNAERG